MATLDLKRQELRSRMKHKSPMTNFPYSFNDHLISTPHLKGQQAERTPISNANGQKFSAGRGEKKKIHEVTMTFFFYSFWSFRLHVGYYVITRTCETSREGKRNEKNERPVGRVVASYRIWPTETNNKHMLSPFSLFLKKNKTGKGKATKNKTKN